MNYKSRSTNVKKVNVTVLYLRWLLFICSWSCVFFLSDNFGRARLSTHISSTRRCFGGLLGCAIIKNATRLTRFSSFCSSYCSCGCCRRTSSTFSSDYENDHRPPSAPSMVEENGPSVMAAQHPTCQQYQRCIHAHNVSAATTLYSRTQRVSSTSAVFTYTCEQYQHCIHVHV